MTAQTILPANTLSSSFDVANSLRFNKAGGSEDYLELTYGANGNRQIMTFSFWMKISKLNTNMYPMAIYDASADYQADLRHASTNQIRFYATDTAGTLRAHLLTNRLFRDTSAWYHIVWKVDTTQGTEANRVKLYVNGVQETDFATETYPPQNTNLRWNGTNADNQGGVTRIGAIVADTGSYDGYLSEFCFIDGTALDADSFGQFDSASGIWQPIKVSDLTFGTNGFYMNFQGSSTGQNVNGFGGDKSGNSNHFGSSHLSAVDTSTDTCTNNFATLNTLHKLDDWSLQEGNLQFTQNSTGHRMVNSTIAVSQGKWYAEVKAVELGGTYPQIGIINPDLFQYNTYLGNSDKGYGYLSNGNKQFGNSAASFGNSYATNDIIGIAMDLDNHKLYFSKNGTFQNSGDPTTGSTGTGSAYDLATGVSYTFGQSSYDHNTDPVYAWNFGSPPYAISSGNADANGHGNFEYAVPSGYFALNTKNLAEFG